MRNAYSYQRLKPNEIRLLELNDLPDGHRLIRRIFSVNRTECPPYTAISYTWGAEKQTETVVCSDPDSSIAVTKNLESALRSVVRSRSRRRLSTGDDEEPSRSWFVWVDAISVDQNFVDEKNVQVSMMQEIYQSAEGVHIWLGDGDEDTERAFDLIGGLVTLSRDEYQPGQHSMLVERAQNQISPESVGLKNADDFERASGAFVCLLKRQWFTRIWIVQEVAASKRARVFCGDFSVDWVDLVKAVKVSLSIKLRPSETLGREQMLRLAQTRDEYRVKSAEGGSEKELEHLQRLLLRHRGSSSTIPHDMIYALRGLCGQPTIFEEHQRWINSLMSSDFELPSMIDWNDFTEQVDYKKSMKDVYTEVASKILSECQTLDLLGACTWPRQSDALPSWVPDWSTSGTRSILSQKSEQLSTAFSIVFSASTEYMQYEVRFYDEERDAIEVPDFELILYLELSGFIVDVIKMLLPSPNDVKVDDLTKEICALLGSEHWKLATTRDDVVCVVPIETQVEDSIGLFQGGKTPLILRKSNDEIDVTNEKEHQLPIWKLIGECYVDGIMDGSKFDIGKCTPFWIS